MLKNRLGIILATAVIVGCAFAIWKFWPRLESETAVESELSSAEGELRLTPEKLAAADIQTERVARQFLQPSLTLPARLAYDEEQHVELRAACEGIVTDLLVRPGDFVQQGQVVAILSSPTVAAARSEVRSALGQLNIAKQQRQWNEEICKGVEELVALVRDGKSPEEIEQSLQDDSLGTYREKLVSAYTRNLLAKQAANSSREAADQGAISGRLQQQREAERQAAEAAVEAIAEQSLYEVQLGCKQSATELAEIQRSFQLSLQRLHTLLGPAANQTKVEDLEKLTDESLPLVHLVAPMDGTIEERLLANNERVETQTPIFVLANTSKLWVVADVRQSDWAAVEVASGTPVDVLVPAAQDGVFRAELLMQGRIVDPRSGATQLVARLAASDPRLRPGLFARLTVPVGVGRDALVVPEQAVVVHEGVAFVFVLTANSPEMMFRRADVTTGLTINGKTEILSGLSEGDSIATSDVFKLKSELLLAGEEE
ncbi:MAG: efflux RND transporter periplasmic adaptor subunit [Pirellulaceae bacterium]